MPSPLDSLAGAGGPLHREAPDAREYDGLPRSAACGRVDAALATLAPLS